MSRQFAEMEFTTWDAQIFHQMVQLKDDAFASGRDVLEALMEYVMRPCLAFISAGTCGRAVYHQTANGCVGRSLCHHVLGSSALCYQGVMD